MWDPEPTEWQHIGNQIDAAFVFAGSDFVDVHRRLHQRWTLNHFFIAVWRAKEAESALSENKTTKAVLYSAGNRGTQLACQFCRRKLETSEADP